MNSETVSETSLLSNEVSYTGAISDSTTGLTYMNARYYNPATGSFTSQDTYLGSAYNPQSQHLYSYTGGNPINFIDPTGHKIQWGKLIGGTLLAVAGLALCATGVGAGAALIAGSIGTLAVVMGASEMTESITEVNPVKELVGEETYGTLLGVANAGTFVFGGGGKALYNAGSKVINKLVSSSADDIVKYVADDALNNSKFSEWLNKGDSNYSVYTAANSRGSSCYTGITKQSITARLYQHRHAGKPFEYLDEITAGLTRNQARSIEQYFIENSSATTYNGINSISSARDVYSNAMQWADSYIKSNNIKIP